MAEIVILAMVFLFVALRLWSVLGRRTGHEQPLAKPLEAPTGLGARMRQSTEALPALAPAADPAVEPQAAAGVRSIADADRGFDAYRFLEGAKSAYRMILEAFWRGDEDELARLVDEDVRAAFVGAIAERRAAGHILENRLIAIENAVIDAANIQNKIATIRVRFDADIAAVTRDADGVVVAGSLSDAVPTHDVWTFSRRIGDTDPNWILVETDEAA